jgi:hypothetical protein
VRGQVQGKNSQEQKPKQMKYMVSIKKKLDCDELQLTSNEETLPIQWTKQGIGSLVAASSFWP